MQAIKKRLLLGMPNGQEAFTLVKSVEALFDNQALKAGGLTFTTTTWQTANTIPYLIDKKMYFKAAFTTQAVPTSIAWAAVASTFNAGAWLIGLDSAGTVTTYPTAVTSTTTSAAAAVNALVWPTVPEGICVIGAIVIYTSTANSVFTPATTAVSGGTGLTTFFIDTVGPFYPVSPI